ncbi:unnamed protein product [Lymnaea stagnalis]|uniref:Uncharacterized protein n=1 Tax=Lymnaea stagnalis TaxID=6523 RepID=A0AAV2HYL3_LYMST
MCTECLARRSTGSLRMALTQAWLMLSPIIILCSLCDRGSAEPSSTTWNAALFRPAYQSSEDAADPRNASLANDGNATSCQRTGNGSESWWHVDLLGQMMVESVWITGSDCNNGKGYTLGYFSLNVFTEQPPPDDSGGQVCHNYMLYAENATVNIKCDKTISGRYVRISHLSNTSSICEFKVMVTNNTQFNKYVGWKNSTLEGPVIRSLNTSRLECANHCLSARRAPDPMYCTAFNWVPGTRLCQLMQEDPRIFKSSKLKQSIHGYFYIEDLR